MRYKIVKKYYHHNDKAKEVFYVMYEKKVWWRKEPVWRYSKEPTYDSSTSFYRDTLKEAEDYITMQIKIENGDFDPVDIKIYECRYSKLNKILND